MPIDSDFFYYGVKMINLSANITIINLDRIRFFENEPGRLEEIKHVAERIASNEAVFFDTKESYSKFLTLVPSDSIQRSRIQQIFKERLGPVETYRLIKLETSILDKNGNKRSIEVPLKLLKKQFPYFDGFESFNLFQKGLSEEILPILLSPDSLSQFINYVYGKEWNITSVEMAKELIYISGMYLDVQEP